MGTGLSMSQSTQASSTVTDKQSIVAVAHSDDDKTARVRHNTTEASCDSIEQSYVLLNGSPSAITSHQRSYGNLRAMGARWPARLLTRDKRQVQWSAGDDNSRIFQAHYSLLCAQVSPFHSRKEVADVDELDLQATLHHVP